MKLRRKRIGSKASGKGVLLSEESMNKYIEITIIMKQREKDKMFFVFGISTKEKELDFSQPIVCPTCEAYGRLEAFMTYTYFSLFFIPLFRWNKKYFIKSVCCGSLYTIDRELGRAIERGEITRIDESDLEVVDPGYGRRRTCRNCMSPLEKDYEYCPRCGMKA